MHSQCHSEELASRPLTIPSSAEKCLTMCGLTEFADAMVGTLGVEQRKRTTIGVELAAKVSVYLPRGTQSIYRRAYAAKAPFVFG